MPICRYFYGSDGIRTRDLRRDRQSRAQQRPVTDATERCHLQGLFSPTPPALRMVEPIVQSTFGPRVGHGILSSRTTARQARGTSPAVAAAQEIVDALPQGIARLEVIDGAGHFPWNDAPDSYWPAIIDFLTEHDGTRTLRASDVTRGSRRLAPIPAQWLY